MKFTSYAEYIDSLGRPPHRGAWIEIFRMTLFDAAQVSPPRRGAWIEIRSFLCKDFVIMVAPRTGGRGLKSGTNLSTNKLDTSPPAQGGVD